MTEGTLRGTAAELRARAEQCLASEAPSAAEAHTLAGAALEFLRTLDARASGTGSPYRDASETTDVDNTTTAVALERALEACQERLRMALAELAALRRRP